jgi:hypothetical protein
MEWRLIRRSTKFKLSITKGGEYSAGGKFEKKI